MEQVKVNPIGQAKLRKVLVSGEMIPDSEPGYAEALPVITGTKRCRCGQEATRLWLCRSCHLIANKASRWRRDPLKKSGRWWVLRTIPEGVTQEQVKEALLKLGVANGWLG